jgi:hypothetical protein
VRWALGALAVVGAGVAAWWLWFREEVSVGGRVLHIERAKGADSRLLDLLTEWDKGGSHVVLVAPDGGVRSAAVQDAKFQAGRARDAAGVWRIVEPRNVLTNADAAHAPHVRGGALDIYPEGFDPRPSWDKTPPDIKDKFRVFGEFAEARGFTWGGRWLVAMPPNGDQPHVEVKGWTNLPLHTSENIS